MKRKRNLFNLPEEPEFLIASDDSMASDYLDSDYHDSDYHDSNRHESDHHASDYHASDYLETDREIDPGIESRRLPSNKGQYRYERRVMTMM
jgi:hypothetical protein